MNGQYNKDFQICIFNSFYNESQLSTIRYYLFSHFKIRMMRKNFTAQQIFFDYIVSNQGERIPSTNHRSNHYELQYQRKVQLCSHRIKRQNYGRSGCGCFQK